MKNIFDIRDFGAIGDSSTINTASVQAAIDRCSQDGGQVLVAGGSYNIGTIYLKSNVELHIAPGAVLLGSTNIADYATDTHKNMYKEEPHMDKCLIFAKDARNFSITGSGAINARGSKEYFSDKENSDRPMMMRFLNCRNIRMRDITLMNPAGWTSAWLYCSDIVVDGITIHSMVNANGDGLDFDGCINVRVSNSSFTTSDDSICLQTSRKDKPCKNVVITNCIMSSLWGGIRIGLLSQGDIDDVTVTGCIFKDIRDAGIKIELCEGGIIQNMIFSNLVMQNVPRPVFMAFCQQRVCVDAPDEIATMNSMRRISFTNITVDSHECINTGVFLAGLPGHCIEDILFDNITLHVGGGGTIEDAETNLPEFDLETLNGWWPGVLNQYEDRGLRLPSYGVFARHVKNLIFRNYSFSSLRDDLRPVIYCEDVKNLELNHIRNKSKSPLIKLLKSTIKEASPNIK